MKIYILNQNFEDHGSYYVETIGYYISDVSALKQLREKITQLKEKAMIIRMEDPYYQAMYNNVLYGAKEYGYYGDLVRDMVPIYEVLEVEVVE